MNISVGDKLEMFVKVSEGVRFDIDGSGAVLYALFSKPTEYEKSQFAMNKPFEIRFTKLDNVIWFTAHFGSLSWIDAPYSPHLSVKLPCLETPNKGEGLSLTVILADCRTGIVQNIRLIGLSTTFTEKLFTEISVLSTEEFDEESYYNNVRTHMEQYDTKELAARGMCNRYKI